MNSQHLNSKYLHWFQKFQKFQLLPSPLPPILCRQPLQTNPMDIWPSSMTMGIWTLPGWNGKFEVEVSLGLSCRIQVLYL